MTDTITCDGTRYCACQPCVVEQVAVGYVHGLITREQLARHCEWMGADLYHVLEVAGEYRARLWGGSL